MRAGLLVLALAGGIAAGDGCIPVDGERIRASDLARALPAFSAVPAEETFGYAPAPGARRIFAMQELARLAERYGIRLAAGSGICFERAMETLSADRVLMAIRAALNREDARVELLDFSRYPAPRGELEFPRAGLGRPAAGQRPAAVLWRGRLRYDGSRSVPVWARVRISIPCTRLVAAEHLPAGRPIQAGQVRLESGEMFPLSEAAIGTLEEAAGKLPRRSIRAGSVLFASLLEAAKEVERGEEVSVEVLSGGAQLRFRARAETAGRRGDLILVKNPSNGRRLTARVDGEGRVVIDANSERGLDNLGRVSAGAGGFGR